MVGWQGKVSVDIRDWKRFAGYEGGTADLCMISWPAGIAAHGAAEDLHQRGLAGPVLAEKCVHFAGPHLQRGVVQRLDAGILLADAAHLQQRGGDCHEPVSRIFFRRSAFVQLRTNGRGRAAVYVCGCKDCQGPGGKSGSYLPAVGPLGGSRLCC